MKCDHADSATPREIAHIELLTGPRGRGDLGRFSTAARGGFTLAITRRAGACGRRTPPATHAPAWSLRRRRQAACSDPAVAQPSCDRPATAEAALTEIPEHLLKRSRERRAGPGPGRRRAPRAQRGESGEAAPRRRPGARRGRGHARRRARPAAVEAAPPEPPKPEPAYVQAAKRRKRVPIWAMPVLAVLPLWGYIYVRTLEPPPAGEDDPLVLGAEVYAGNCASCHGGTGGGGVGPALADGEVVADLARPPRPRRRGSASAPTAGPGGDLRRHRQAGRRRRHHAGRGRRSPTRRSPRSCCTSASSAART